MLLLFKAEALLFYVIYFLCTIKLGPILIVVGTDLKSGKGESLRLPKSELDKLKIDGSYVQTALLHKAFDCRIFLSC